MSDAQAPANTDLELEPERVAELVEAGEAELVDVREGYEHEAGRIAGSRHIPLNELSARAGEVPREGAVVFVCRGGGRSAMAAEAFAQAGWDARNLAGGLEAWVERGLPLDPPDGTVAERRPV